MGDIFLQIANLSRNFSLSTILVDQNIAERLLENATPMLPKLLDGCDFETKGTQYLTEVDWTLEEPRATFTSSTCLIFEKEFEARIQMLSDE